jgi:hypothetical protein
MIGDKELSILKKSFPKAKGNNWNLAVPEDLFLEVTSNVSAIKWFKLYNKDGSVIGTVYLFLDSNTDNIICVVNKLHPKENDNPRISIKYAFEKFLKGEYFILDKLSTNWNENKEFLVFRFNFTISYVFNVEYNRNRSNKDFIGCINYLNKNK